MFWRHIAASAIVHTMAEPFEQTSAAGARPSSDATTHFGFRTVPAGEKASLVRDVFASVATRYDLMNDLMSFGVHRLWKAAMVDRLGPCRGGHIIDVGGGTGDIAMRALDRGCARVTVVDVNVEMIRVGRDRSLDAGRVAGLGWVCGDAERLPLPDRCADGYTIAFCIRNCTRIDRVLREARRVLRPGGRFVCLEFSRVILPVLDRAYDAWSFAVLPALGQLVAGDRESYRYLAESIRRFPDQDAFAGMIAEAGLERIRVQNLSGGIAAIHAAWRL